MPTRRRHGTLRVVGFFQLPAGQRLRGSQGHARLGHVTARSAATKQSPPVSLRLAKCSTRARLPKRFGPGTASGECRKWTRTLPAPRPEGPLCGRSCASRLRCGTGGRYVRSVCAPEPPVWACSRAGRGSVREPSWCAQQEAVFLRVPCGSMQSSGTRGCSAYTILRPPAYRLRPCVE
jgi:hypothetical protein